MTNGSDLGRRRSEELWLARLRLALRAAGLGVWDWDVGSGGLIWDDNSRAMFGLPAAESTHVVADAEPLVHLDDLPRVQAALAEAIRTAGSLDVEFRIVRPDGAVHWVRAQGEALVDDSGQVRRLVGTNLDVTEQRQAKARRAADAQRMASLIQAAQALGEAQTDSEVLDVISVRGGELLGARGAILCFAGSDGRHARALTTQFLDAEVRADVAELPVDFPLPMVHAATTGTAHFFADRAAAVAAFPGGAELFARARTEGSAAVPLRAHGQVFGSLSVCFDRPHVWREADRELLEAFAAMTGQSLDRIRAGQAERKATRASQRLSEALQRSLLTDPPESIDLDIAVRYQPAAEEAKVGGDWYDVFLAPNGSTTLIIGDVAGHDWDATAEMAQVRNVLRGIAQTLGEPPAEVLSALDRALHGLRIPSLVTAVFCQINRAGTDSSRNGWALRWSNAGHPPPLLIQPDGTAALLWQKPDTLLGLNFETPRYDHDVVLSAGATIVLYTDGLVERRDRSLHVGLEQLRVVAAELHGLSTEELCDALLDRLAQDAEDDVALLVLRPKSTPEPRSMN